MRTRTVRDPRREAFTLIELLIVIGIIAVLVSLTAAAVMKVLDKRAEVGTRSELSQLDGAVQAFMTQYQINYVPSQLVLCRQFGSYNQANQLDNDSANYILKTIGLNSNAFKTVWSTTGINWNSTAPAREVLQGQQVLVFLLGGLQVQTGTGYNCVGFSNDVSSPSSLGGTRNGPFFQFDTRRLSPPPAPAGSPPPTYCAYQDYYGARKDGNPRFYAFFSSYKTPNGYNRYGTSDCYALPGSPWPYAVSPATGTLPMTYVNPTSWQIICSGLDGEFGPGTSPTSHVYWNGTPISPPGADDQANFAGGKLNYGR